ncbi:MAG: FecR domain-containing protein [Spirochaetales bacterium]|nr:FecR domain-containing protein [Spirochaetales bacterium]
MSKRFIFIAIWIGLAVSLSGQDAMVKEASGSVETRISNGEWTPVQVGQSLASNTTISTGFGAKAILEIGGMSVTLAPLTRIRIDELETSGAVPKTALSLQAGRLRASRPAATRRSASAIDFRVSSPVATAAVRGTDFEMSPTRVKTKEGVVSYSQGRTVVLAPAGTTAYTTQGQQTMDPAETAVEAFVVETIAGIEGLLSAPQQPSTTSRGSLQIILQ